MNTYSLKDKYNQSLKPWFFALAVCFISNLLLYFLFSMSSQESNKAFSNRPKIIMIPLDNKLLSNNLNSIIEWMNDENPTLIVNPSLQYGYSSILLPGNSINFQEPAVSLIDYTPILTEQPAFLTAINVSTIPLKILTITDTFNQLTNIQTAFLPVLKPYNTLLNKGRFPNISEFYTGVILPISFYGLGENNSLINKFKPQKNTIIELYMPENKSLLSSGKIIESSVSSDLDSLALNNLTTTQLPENIWNKYKGNTLFIKVEWSPLFKKAKED